jgi:hypothetical protein
MEIMSCLFFLSVLEIESGTLHMLDKSSTNLENDPIYNSNKIWLNISVQKT